MSAFNQAKGLKRIIKTLSYSKDGFKVAIKEPAIFQLICLHLPLMAAALWLDFAVAVKMILIVGSFLSLIVEFFNTALEAAVDHTSMEIHPLAKIAKDVGSSAQWLALILVAILWTMALFA
ncbi:diacylglycerol kinase [Moraxella nasibovis]|uniref:diacylglycerol kinase n=1 Tax=Moraxella nasibovis TaxID=2904120 RepID=UPI00240F1B35|nr:diacylglycerol kinase [Moraxella nasibovis]WFF38871.1 diacylglycerol kinase [Moraxella nasibovis]